MVDGSALRLDLAGWTGEATHGDPEAFMAIFEQAEQLGFDGVWFNEFRLAEPPAPYPSPLLLASALLARTSRLRVGLSVLVLPLHQPLLLAEEINQVYWQSGGRLDVGLGRGTDDATLRALGIEVESTRARFEQGFLTLRDRGVTAPLYIAGTTQETVSFASVHQVPLLLSLEPPEASQLRALEVAYAGQIGPDADARRRALLTASSLSRYVCVAPTRARAMSLFDTLRPLLHQRRLHFARKRGASVHDVRRYDRDAALRDQFIVGTPDDCVRQILAACATTGVHRLRLVFNGNGVLSNMQAVEGMREFASNVMPQLRGLEGKTRSNPY